ncbi:MAG: MerR family transcriptional regulator [Deltaproteobacteria bacterium]|nr:MerR family transcriptional regulator [Deltaproteobacteria bacterium]
MPRRRRTRPPKPGLRMAELSKRAGVSRETIHFYLREGLLDAPHKTSRNMAWYDDGHLQRILLIKRLQQEKFLPLGVIKNLIRDGKALSTDGDVDFFADLITLDARRGASKSEIPPPLEPAMVSEAARYAEERGWLRSRDVLREPSEERVLAAVAEAFTLDLDARSFALADMESCVAHLQRLVRDETGVLVARLLGSGDLRATMEAFRTSRPAVSRFIRAYRASLVHRIVEEALTDLDRAANQRIDSLAVPLSPGARAAAGVDAERDRLASSGALLRVRARLEMGVGDLDRLGELVGSGGDAGDAEIELYRTLGALRAGDAPGAHARVHSIIAGLEREDAYVDALAGTLGLVALVGHGPDFAGSRIALAAAPLRLLERAIAAAPDATERDRAFTLYLTARSFLALPPIAGRRATGVAHLEALLSLVEGKTTIETAGDALHLTQNAHLLLADAFEATDPLRARAHRDRARAIG